MKQVLQSLKTGVIEVVEAPAPQVRPGHVLIETRRSLISAGTERMLLEFGKSNLLQKALQQPEKVDQTIKKIRTDGIAATVDALRSKLDQPIPLGYCNAGIVRAIGVGVTHVKPGDRVVSNAPHAELAVIGRNLVAKIPDSVSDDEAAFTPLAAIALQGCRLSKPELGETFCVIGLGLIGLLAVQLLRAHGCRVICVDYSEDRLALARDWGADAINLSAGEDPVSNALAVTQGAGVDGVIIAATTKSDDVIAQAARMSRKRGRIVLVGVIGLKLARADFYEKELTFQVSCSYGPGRYEPDYELKGLDYPAAFVRWTEQRNFAAVLAEMERGRLQTQPLISGATDISDAAQVYSRLTNQDARDLGLLLTYPDNDARKFINKVTLHASAATNAKSQPSVALIGAGGFAARFTAPGLQKAGARLKTIVSQGGVSSVLQGRRSGFEEASTDVTSVMNDEEIDTVAIATRHDSHASLVQQALLAGKNVFVEKPLALTQTQIDAIEIAIEAQRAKGISPRLIVGFNRRFAPLAIRMKQLLDTVHEPKCMIAVINAGPVPPTHWTQDPEQGGGRIVGEACHFIDLMRFLADAPIKATHAVTIGRPGKDKVTRDKVTITVEFEDGSLGTLHYFANGPAALPKERYEVFAGGRHLYLENFTSLRGTGWPSPVRIKRSQDKGQLAIVDAFVASIRNGAPSPIPLEEIMEVSRWTIRASENAKPAI